MDSGRGKIICVVGRFLNWEEGSEAFGEVFFSRGDVFLSCGEVAESRGDVLLTPGEVAEGRGDVTFWRGEVFLSSGEVAGGKSEIAGRKSEVAEGRGDVLIRCGEVAGSKAEVAGIRASPATSRAGVAATRKQRCPLSGTPFPAPCPLSGTPIVSALARRRPSGPSGGHAPGESILPPRAGPFTLPWDVPRPHGGPMTELDQHWAILPKTRCP